MSGIDDGVATRTAVVRLIRQIRRRTATELGRWAPRSGLAFLESRGVPKPETDVHSLYRLELEAWSIEQAAKEIQRRAQQRRHALVRAGATCGIADCACGD